MHQPHPLLLNSATSGHPLEAHKECAAHSSAYSGFQQPVMWPHQETAPRIVQQNSDHRYRESSSPQKTHRQITQSDRQGKTIQDRQERPSEKLRGLQAEARKPRSPQENKRSQVQLPKPQVRFRQESHRELY